MAGFFFARHHAEAGGPGTFYRYKGYRLEDAAGIHRFPVVLHFGRDEVIFSFQAANGRTVRVFSLYVAEGELNHAALCAKIQHYWREPAWTPPPDLTEEDGAEDCRLDETLARESFFTLLNNGKTGEADGRIDFRRLLLDFLFELEYAATFEDPNFFHLQPVLQNNRLLDALTRKCAYLRELASDEVRNWKRRLPGKREPLPKPFRRAEKAWLRICFNESYREIFTAAESVFAPVEEEVRQVVFRKRIGAARRCRRRLFARRNDEEVRLRNQLATFFLRRYSVLDAFRILLPAGVVPLVPLVILAIPFGDLLASILTGLARGGPGHLFAPQGVIPMWVPFPLFAYLLPLLLAGVMVVDYWRRGINLFKLMLPRLFLGLLLGWSIFWTTEELWKAGVTMDARNGILFSLIVLGLTVMYVFTEIRNRLVRVSGAVVLGRTVVFVGFAVMLSLVVGFYGIQFKARPMLENSGFLDCINAKQLHLDDDYNKSEGNSIELLTHQETWGGHNLTRLRGSNLKGKWACLAPSGKPGMHSFTLYYLWSVFAAHTMMAILAGVVLQLIWEERPITEPL